MLQNDEVDFEAFVGAVEAADNKKVQQQNQDRGFAVPDCVSIGDKAIVRFVNGIAETALDQGKPGSGRAKLFNIGWVRDDNDKAFLLTLPAIINNKPMYPSIMVDFIDAVLKRTWIENPNATEGQPKGAWQYFYENRDDYGQQQSGTMTLKQIYWKVFKSGANPQSQFYRNARSWRGQTIYVGNVIDRLNYKWHQDNKRTKLLMRSVKIDAENVRRKEVSFYAIGTPLKELTDNHGVKLNYDVLIVPGKNPTDKFNLKNVSKLKEKDYWDDVKNIITDSDKAAISSNPGFTDEEATWEPIDIDKFYRITSAGAILKHFGKTIKAFDMMTGSNFYERFQEEAAANAKAAKSANPDLANTESTPVAKPVEAPKVESAPTAAPVTNLTPSFDKMENVAPSEPPAMEVSPEAQADIDTFYDTL